MELCHEGDEDFGSGEGLEGEEAEGEEVGVWGVRVGAPRDGFGDVIWKDVVQYTHGHELGGDHFFSAFELVDLSV